MSIFFIIIAMFQAPISLCVVMLLQIIMCSLDLGIYKGQLWTNFIFMLIFFGGLIVLFIYVRRVRQNESLYINTQLLWLTPILLISVGRNYRILTSTKCPRIEYFTQLGWGWAVLGIFYLLLALILLVKVSRPQFGALRTEI